MQLTASQIIQILNLKPLPVEGGWFFQSYLSEEKIPGQSLPTRYKGDDRPYGTAIYYLLTDHADSFSAFHRLLTDEVFHFYLGDPLELTLLYPDGQTCQVILGQDLIHGQHLQYVIPAGVWQGSRVLPGGHYSLIGTSMAPGFSDADYEHGDRDTLLMHYPGEMDRILRLTR